MNLCSKTCVPCRGGIPPMSEDEAKRYIQETPDWLLIDRGRKIKRIFPFKNFALAMGFAEKVGVLSEQENHHPDITFGWGYCQVVFYSHKINGLHENDFIMAAKVNQLKQPQ